ncbi:hypothetical protein GHL01_00380 [Sinorhizobium meliloti]|uniref:phage tail tube protein n=1 Tax=Rhizobium meliloti TaxID=382 RepID=UPI00129629E7|nr:hypothetical protein [Sinorhizobium meliloti]MQV12201.1 hypothetical protein [Sinorhizobium meliloti]
MAAYSVLSSGYYEIPRAEVLARQKINGVLVSPVWQQIGDVDKFGISFTPTKASRYRKNARVRTKAVEVVMQTDSAITFTCYQFSPFVRMMALLGEKMAYSQTSGTFTYETKGAVGLHFVGKQDISTVTIEHGVTPTNFPAEAFKVVDPELGIVEILSLPSGVTETTDIKIKGANAAIAAGSRNKTKIGANVSNTLEFMVRDVGAASNPKAYHLFECEVSPNGEINFIGEDDFTSQEFSGSILDTSEGFGYMIELAA